ncbi:MAG: hypothetical protein ACR2RA_16680, partial [Geminicoccaceae bacterium]
KSLESPSIIGLFIDRSQAERNRYFIVGMRFGTRVDRVDCAVDDRINACFTSIDYGGFPVHAILRIRAHPIFLPGMDP